MCGRFAITLPTDAMAQIFAAAPANDLPEVPKYNVCPTDRIHVISLQNDARRLGAMRWGFIPSWYKSPNDGPLLINARAETIADKPAFRDACRARRCVVAVTGFYEWTKDAEGARDPWYITRQDGAPLALAGVWQEWEDAGAVIQTCALVTTGANRAMTALHHRMPVVLSGADIGLWLGEGGKGAARLMRAAPEDALCWHRVDRAVNTNWASGPSLIEPLAGGARGP